MEPGKSGSGEFGGLPMLTGSDHSEKCGARADSAVNVRAMSVTVITRGDVPIAVET
jgi:hypothetical protein